MMSIAHLYTDFSDVAPGFLSEKMPVDDVLQDAQLSGFEEGYQAGWEDAAKAKDSEGQKLTEDFVQSVQDISFTYREAYAKLSESMQPLMSGFVTSVLPTVAQKGLRLQLIDQVKTLLEENSERAIELVISPSRRTQIEDILGEQAGIPFSVSEDTTLSDGQIYLRVNEQEREINIDAVLAEVSKAVDAYFHLPKEELNYG